MHCSKKWTNFLSFGDSIIQPLDYKSNALPVHFAQGSTEGDFLPSAEAEAEGAKKLRPSAEDRSRSRRFQIIEILNLFVYKV